ncbi:hypothetical protein [Microbacterium halotolerans]|uniref:hypothetical protein n=1 Tax=Microbacterium halotolerans TaxID=246613 RepID=UPI000E6AC929|nr:hypothetical protein [Microbacterium halotolerans]
MKRKVDRQKVDRQKVDRMRRLLAKENERAVVHRFGEDALRSGQRAVARDRGLARGHGGDLGRGLNSPLALS